MPFKIRKVKNKECYQVKNVKTGVVHSKCSTKMNAEKQVKLLYMMEHKK